jgi:uncharacterized integral membrane protein
VQWTVSRAVANGLITEHLPFTRTSKGGLSRMSVEFQAFWEAVIGVLLWIGAAVLVMTNTKEVREIYIFAGVLILQSLPFLSAVAIALLENSRLNSFAWWRSAGIHTAELIGIRPVGAHRQIAAAQAAPVAWLPAARSTELTSSGHDIRPESLTVSVPGKTSASSGSVA